MPYLLLVAFMATIPLANYLIQHVGVTCIPDGPCLVPVWPGLMAPSGVLAIGVALVLRDAVHEMLGAKWSVIAIFSGTVLSVFLAPPSLVVASGLAFLFSELADLTVYAPLRKRAPGLAVIASGVVGATVDSLIFLSIAFGSLQFLLGQVVGKMWMSVIAGVCILLIRWYRQNFLLDVVGK